MDNKLTDEGNYKQENSRKTSFLKNIAQNHAAVFAVLFLLINIVIGLLKLWPSGFSNMVVRMNLSTVTNVAAGLFFLFFAHKTDMVKDIGLFSTKGILKGLLLGLPTVSIWIYYALGYASIWHLRKVPKVSDILFALLLFGILHYFQWHENSFQTTLHVLHTTLLGVFLSTVFLLSKNIWSAIIVHALYDLVEFMRYFVFYFQSFMNPVKEVNGILGTSLPENANADWSLALVFMLPILAAAVIYLSIIVKNKDVFLSSYQGGFCYLNAPARNRKV